MTHSFFKLNRAALFREWRTSRGWLLGVGLLSLLGPVGNVASSFFHNGQGSTAENVFWSVLVPAIYGFHYSPTGALPPTFAFHSYSDPNVSASWALIAVLFSTILWAKDRSSDALYGALTAPIKRVEIVLYKFGWASTLVLGIQLLRGMIIVVLKAWVGSPLSWNLVLGWWITNTLCMLVAVTTALLITSVVTPWVPGVIMANAILFVPFAVASFLDKVIGYTSASPSFGVFISGPAMVQASEDPLGWLKALSPLKLTGMSTSMGGNPVQIEFDSGAHYLFMAGWVWAFWGIWILTALLWSIRLFSLSPTENMSLFFVFPRMWTWMIGIFSLLVGYTLSTRVAAIHGMSFFIATVIFALLTFVIFLILIRVIRTFTSWPR